MTQRLIKGSPMTRKTDEPTNSQMCLSIEETSLTRRLGWEGVLGDPAPFVTVDVKLNFVDFAKFVDLSVAQLWEL